MSRRTPSLARRAFPAIALTAVGVGLVQGLDRPNAMGAVGAIDTNAQTAAAAGAPTPSTADGSVAAAQAPVSGNVAPAVTAAPQTAAPQTAAPQAAPAQTAPPATAAPAPVAPATGGTCGEVTGVGAQQEITWRRSYGVISVTAKFTASGDLCNASAQWQAYDSKSQRYEEYAVPILNQQAEAVDSANVQGVSGATAITNAYRASLQSAIDNRH